VSIRRRRRLSAYLQPVGGQNVSTYQCFFFADGGIGYRENIECRANTRLITLLQRRTKRGNWDYIEAWLNGTMACVVRRESVVANRRQLARSGRRREQHVARRATDTGVADRFSDSAARAMLASFPRPSLEEC
jgi:hypothetical protein